MNKLRRLKQLLKMWEDRVEFLTQSKYEGTFYLYDYLNDMDIRESIEECMSTLSNEEKKVFLPKVEDIDSKLKDMTETTDICIWGKENEQQSNWTPTKNWWYYRRPKNLASGWGWDDESE